MMFSFGAKSLSNLRGVHPDLVAVARLALAHSPVDFMVIEGVRDLERQKMLKAQGASRTLKSKHLIQDDGWGHALDVMAVGDINGDGSTDHRDKSLTWDPEVYGRIAKAFKLAANALGVKIKWGGDFKGFFDGPHFELER